MPREGRELADYGARTEEQLSLLEGDEVTYEDNKGVLRGFGSGRPQNTVDQGVDSEVVGILNRWVSGCEEGGICIGIMAIEDVVMRFMLA